MTTVVASQIPQQLAYLDRVIEWLNAELKTAVLQGVRIRPEFIETWVQWRKLWQAQRTGHFTEAAVDGVSKRVDDWITWIKGEGVNLGHAIDDLHQRSMAGLELPFGLGRIWTPSAVYSELQKAKTYIDAVDRDVQQPDVRQKFPSDVSDWNAFHDEFESWFKSGPSTVWGATATKAIEYEDRAAAFRQRFNQLGAAMHGVASPGEARTPMAGPNAPDKSLVHLGELALGAAIVIAGVVMIGPYLPRPRRPVTA